MYKFILYSYLFFIYKFLVIKNIIENINIWRAYAQIVYKKKSNTTRN